MKSGQRWLIIGGLLVATVGAAAWVSNGDDETQSETVAAATERKDMTRRSTTPPAANPPAASQSGTHSNVPRIDLDKLNARNPGELVRDPFAVAAPKPKKNARANGHRSAAPPPPQSAPPVPFTYMGKLRSGADTAVFLTQGDRNLVLREGDTIDSVYRVEHIADSEITLVYLPLSQRQTIPIGEPP